MTPLAFRLMKETLAPLSRRTFNDAAGLLPSFKSEFHCFEVTDVTAVARDLRSEMLKAALPSIELSFLPAPQTWIETRDDDGSRIGYLLVQSGEWADVFLALAIDRPDAVRTFTSQKVGRIALRNSIRKIGPVDWNSVEKNIFQPDKSIASDAKKYGVAVSSVWWIYSYLLLINTPTAVDRETRDPHRALARKVAAQKDVAPLQKWTEILLPASARASDKDDAANPARSISLHWTRAHMKRVHGVWTLISDYWSGDDAVGTRYGRYTVKPGASR